MKGPDGVSSHPRNPHRQGVSADNETMKGKVESRQCRILCEGATMQKMIASDNAGPEDDGNASVSAGEALGRKAKRLGNTDTTGCDVPMIISD
ncbi:hypothetical protein [Phocaeicola sp.]|uniref:hypothetical protein n=1 Tax=Phocaeicola sp. TaxID=2773926 RepID=UPI0023BF487C|nr:hypothetical protein [Phocaeicola sp.]MDE5677289.1 hypothetical protein [Phocaeicola sp.]